MKPKIPARLRDRLAATGDPKQCGRYKLVCPRGKTHYGVEIDGNGTIIRIDGKPIFSSSEIRFRVSDIKDIVAY